MNIATKAIDLLVNPPRNSDPDRLRAAVAGKTVLVTGASYGLGEATAQKLAAAGGTTLLVARSVDKLNELAATLTDSGGRAGSYTAALSRQGAAASLAARITQVPMTLILMGNYSGERIRRPLHLQYSAP